MTENPIVTGLTEYVEQNKIALISKAVLGSKTASMLNLQSGVVGPTKMNIMDVDVEFGDGSVCGWDEAGSTEFTQRELVPAMLKVNMAFCDKKMLKTFAQYQVKVAAGQKTLPFEEEWTNLIVDKVAEKVEQMIWQGDSENGNEFDGLIKTLKADATIKVAKNAGTSVYSAIKEVYAALPETAIKSDTVIFVSDGTFRTFVQELVSANLYHYDANDAAGEVVIPGTAIKVVAVSGLNGADADYIVAGRLSNIFYGVDMENDSEVYDLWYSKDNREFRLAIEFCGSTNVAFPDEIVLGSIAKA